MLLPPCPPAPDQAHSGFSVLLLVKGLGLGGPGLGKEGGTDAQGGAFCYCPVPVFLVLFY